MDVETQEPETGNLLLGTRADARKYISELDRYYVYILRRPDHRPFYVGKGKGDRVFQHENEARHKGNHPKLNVIRAIKRNNRSLVYEIDSVHQMEMDAYARETLLIEGFKRLHEGGPLTNLAAGGGSESGPSPLSTEKHRVSLGGIPEDDPEKATINAYLLSIGRPDSICVKVASRFKARQPQPYPNKVMAPTPRQAFALIASAAANSIYLAAPCTIPRLFSIDGIEGVIENGVSCDMITSGLVNLVNNSNPRHEKFTLNQDQIDMVIGLIGVKKLRDLGLIS